MKGLITAAVSIAIVTGATTFAADDEPIKRQHRPSKSYRVGVLEPDISIPHFARRGDVRRQRQQRFHQPGQFQVAGPP